MSMPTVSGSHAALLHEFITDPGVLFFHLQGRYSAVWSGRWIPGVSLHFDRMEQREARPGTDDSLPVPIQDFLHSVEEERAESGRREPQVDDSSL